MPCSDAVLAQTAPLHTQLIAEVRERVSTSAAVEAHRYVPAGLLVQGQTIYYTLRITNRAPASVRNVAVVQAVPANTVYVTGSAAAPGAAVSFSIDGAQSFAPAAQLLIAAEGGARPAPPERYTHIRWQLRNPLAPGATALARFQAVFQ